MGMLAEIQAISADSTKLATDQGTLASLQQQVTAQAAVIATDQTSAASDNTALSLTLQALPAGTVVRFTNPDGTFSGYSYSAAAPGFTIVPVVDAT